MIIRPNSCPCCGSKAKIVIEHPLLPNGKRDTFYYVECTRQDCGIKTRKWYPKIVAIKTWNQRICLNINKDGDNILNIIKKGIVKENTFRGYGRGVNETDDMIRIVVDLPIIKFNQLKRL